MPRIASRIAVGSRVRYRKTCANASATSQPGALEGRSGVVMERKNVGRYLECRCEYRYRIQMDDSGEMKWVHEANIHVEAAPNASNYTIDVGALQATDSILTIARSFKEMFTITVIETKAGYVGQIKNHNKILWESEPFEDDPDVPTDPTTMRSSGQAKADKAAKEHVDTSLDKLLNS